MHLLTELGKLSLKMLIRRSSRKEKKLLSSSTTRRHFNPISDFIDEHNGFLSLTDEEYKRAKQANPRAKKYARRFLEYGENREGYWTRDKFIDQMKSAVEMAELKYPKEEGWRLGVRPQQLPCCNGR